MSKPGYYNMGVGLGIGALGAIITAGTFALAPGGHFVVAYGAIFVGAIQFVVGAFQFMSFSASPKSSQDLHFAQIELKALVRSMLAVAAADGHLHEEEVLTVQQIVRSVAGVDLDVETVEKIFGQMNSKNYSIHDDLKSTQSQLSPEMKKLIVKACYFVVHADNDVDAREKKRWSEICGALNLSGVEVQRILEEVRA